jgi:hypothetical protein
MKKFLKRVWSFIKTLFLNPEVYIEKYIVPSIETINLIKNAVDSPVALFITQIIPTNIDEVIRQSLSRYLAIIIDGFTKGMDVLNSEDKDEDKIIKFIVWMQGLSPVLRSAIYLKMSAKLSQLSSGEFDATVKNHSIDLLTQLTYSKIKTGVNESSLQIVRDANLIDIPRAL